jgi:hypothetical protein
MLSTVPVRLPRLADASGLTICTGLLLAACLVANGPAVAASSPANVDAARLAGADQDATNWMTYGRTYGEQRFSPLTRITADNAKQLPPALAVKGCCDVVSRGVAAWKGKIFVGAFDAQGTRKNDIDVSQR